MKSGENASVFDILNTDAKLYLFRLLSKKDVAAVCSTNKSNHQIMDKPRFWQQRALLDQHHVIPANAYAKNIYLNDYRADHIKKIVDMLYFTVGIDRRGHLHILNESFKDCREAHKRLAILNHFAASQEVLDIHNSSGGTIYIQTKTGLYAMGSNFHGQMSADKHTRFDDIRLVQASLPGKIILQTDCGMDFSMVRTQDELLFRGKISAKSNNVMKFRGDNILDVKCSSRKAFVLKRNHTLFAVDDTGMKPVLQFVGKKVYEVQTHGNQTLVRCDDGIYVDGNSEHGNLGLFQQSVSFAKIPFFDNKTIFSANLSTCHMIVHCKEGIYVAGLNNIGRLGTGDLSDRYEFTKLDLDQNQVTNIHLTSNSFFEIDGKWTMAGTFAATSDIDQHKRTFQEVHFSR